MRLIYYDFLGINEKLQLRVLDEMEEVTKNMYFLNNRGKLVQQPFQTGILISIKSIRHLLKDLKGHGVKYLLTSKVNQDALENQFSSVRYMGGSNSHPTASLFCDRIRMLCVSKNIKIVLENSAVELESDQDENTISADLLDEIPCSNMEKSEGNISLT